MSTAHVLLFIILSLIRKYEYICLLTAKSDRTIIDNDFKKGSLYVDFNNTASFAKLSKRRFTTPLCAQIKPGVVSLSSSEKVGYTVTGDKLFQRMGAAPFFFTVNFNPYYMESLPAGVCSLKVDWSC